MAVKVLHDIERALAANEVLNIPSGALEITASELQDPDGNIAVSSGTTVPTNGTAGYLQGAIFIHTDGAAAGVGDMVYLNIGTAASCIFVPLSFACGVTLNAEFDDVDFVDRWILVNNTGVNLCVNKISEVHTVAGTDAGAVTLDVKKLTGVGAPSTGTTLLSSTFNLKSTANTVVNATVVTAGSANILANGDKLGLDFTGTPTGLQGGVVSIGYYAVA